MDILKKELDSRYSEIKSQIEAIFAANSHITGWDVPEVDEKEAALLLLEYMQKALDEVKEETLKEING
jgi:hypothetical protein